MNLEILIPVFLVAILTVIGNIVFFRYQFKKDSKWKILHQQLTEFLLPLFYVFKNDELNQSEWFNDNNMDPHEFLAEEPKRLVKKLTPIVKSKLYLADDELHASCIKFLEWAYTANENDRFQESHTKGVSMDKVFFDFKELVYKKYNNARNNYLK